MSTTKTLSPTPIARLREQPAVAIIAGLLTVAIGQIVFEAGLEARLWGTRLPGYFGPASLLGAGSTGHGAVVSGALLFLVGFAVATLGAYRVMGRVEAAARLVSGPGSRIFPSIHYLAGGLLAVALGLKLNQAGWLAGKLTPGGFLGVRDILGTNAHGQIAGTIVGIVGLCLLLLGVYRLLGTIQVLVDAGPVSRARRTPARSTVLTVGSLLSVAVGQILARAAVDVQIGVLRSPDSYFGPALLLGSDFTGHDAFRLGAALSFGGLVLVLAGVYRVTSQIDAAAEVARAAPSRTSLSAPYFTGGLLALVVGYELSQAGQLTQFLREAGFNDALNLLRHDYLLQIPGAIAGVVGLCLLLLGTFRLVTNVLTIADAV